MAMESIRDYRLQLAEKEARLTDHLKKRYRISFLKRTLQKLEEASPDAVEKARLIAAFAPVIASIKTELPVTATEISQFDRVLSKFLKMLKHSYGWRQSNEWHRAMGFIFLLGLIIALVVRLFNVSFPSASIMAIAMPLGMLMNYLMDKHAKKAGKII